MNRFAYAKAVSFQEAGTLLKDSRFKLPVLKGGGMDLLDHMKEGLIEPDLLIDVRGIDADGGKGIEESKAGMMFHAGATLADVLNSEMLRTHAPVLGQSIESAATPQVRNVATVAGNLLQRPRCWYYRHAQFDCLKKGGDRCYAVEGENQYHAIFGDGPCHIVHPSNLAPALIVCDAIVNLAGADRQSLSISELFHMPETGVKSEHTLKTGEMITGIVVPKAPHSGFCSIKEKQSFDWPLAMAAAALEMDGTMIKSAKVCAGAVAPVPWALPEVEKALAGVNVDDDARLRAACALAANGARPMRDNAYKVKLLPVAVRRAVLRAAGKWSPEGKEG